MDVSFLLIGLQYFFVGFTKFWGPLQFLLSTLQATQCHAVIVRQRWSILFPRHANNIVAISEGQGLSNSVPCKLLIRSDNQSFFRFINVPVTANKTVQFMRVIQKKCKICLNYFRGDFWVPNTRPAKWSQSCYGLSRLSLDILQRVQQVCLVHTNKEINNRSRSNLRELDAL